MTYAQIVDGTIVAQGRPPRVALVDGRWLDLRVDANLPLAGWFAIVDTDRPADTDTTTHTRSVELVDGTPTVVWTPRPWTEAELLARLEADAPDPVSVLVARTVADANTTPQPWVQPLGAHDAYLPGAIALDGNGDRWQNTLTIPNVWPLDVHGWSNLDAADPGGEWQPDTAYGAGAEVTYNGIRYVIVTPHTSQVVWEPPNVPALWAPVG